MRTALAVSLAVSSVSALRLSTRAQPLDVHSLLTAEVLAATRSPREQPISASVHSDSLISKDTEDHIHATMKLWGVQGVQVAVVRRKQGTENEWDVDVRAYGVKDRKGFSMRIDTLFPIASNSKAFTAASVALLVANDSLPQFDWRTKLQDVLPEFELQDPIAAQLMDVVDMLGHRSGLPRHDFLMVPEKDSAFKILKNAEPSTEFRNVWQYNNHFYNLATIIVERVSGIPFFDFASEYLFKAMGFKHTKFYSKEVKQSGRISEGFWRYGETNSSAGTIQVTEVWDHLDLRATGAGCVLGSGEDMALWLQTLLSDGKSPRTGKQVIPAEALAKISSAITVPAPGLPTLPELAKGVYGMGFAPGAYQGHQFIEHGGALPGFHSQIIRFPNDGLGIAVLSNDDRTFTHESIKWRIAEELLGLPEQVNWNLRYKLGWTILLQMVADAEAALLPSPPDASPPDAPLHALATTFNHPSYGRVPFAYVPRTDKSSPAHLTADGTEWLSFDWNIRATHYDGNLFNLTVTLHMEALDSVNGTLPFEANGMELEFDVSEGGVVHGFGIRAGGGFYGAGFGVDALPTKGSVKERSEVYFVREVQSGAEGQVVLGH